MKASRSSELVGIHTKLKWIFRETFSTIYQLPSQRFEKKFMSLGSERFLLIYALILKTLKQTMNSWTTKVSKCTMFQYKQSSAGIHLLKVNNRNTRTRCEIYSKLTIKTPERHHDVVLASLLLTMNISHILFLLLTLNK